MAKKSALPDWLLEARVRNPGNALSDESVFPVRLNRGEIRLLESMDGDELPPRVVVITDTDVETGTASVVLVTNEFELATASDVLVLPDESGLPYQAVVETDVVTSVWAVQVATKLGRLSPDLPWLDAVLRGNSESAPAGRRGLPVLGRSDSRWAWKESEVLSLQALAAPCLAHLLDTESAEVLIQDPALERCLAAGWEGLATLAGVIDAINDSDAVLEPAGVSLASAGIEAFADLPAGLGHDAILALGQAVQGRPTLSGAREGAEDINPEWRPRRIEDPSTSAKMALALGRCLDAGSRTVRVLTSQASWGAAMLTGDCALARVGTRRVQVVCQVV